MPTTVFFSWQSDCVPRDARNFIDTALRAAIKRLSLDAEVEESVREDLLVDKDTENVPGSPRIFQTILSKIDAAAVFLADLTYVARRPNGDPTPNPNVLIEYGYALKSLGDSCIISVMNATYGEPNRQTMPFDLIERRWPITFDLPAGADDDKRKSEREALSKKLESALKAFFSSGAYKGKIDKLNQSTTPTLYREPLDGRARFRAEGQPIGFTREPFAHLTGAEARKIFLDGGQAMWLRVGPQKPLEPLMKVTNLESTVQGIAVLPLYEASEPPSLVWNSDGAGWVRTIGTQPSPSTAFMFTDGEIWTINTLFFKYSSHLILLEEERYAETLKQCAAHLDRIGLKGPYRFVAGIEGIEGLYLPTPNSTARGPGPCTVPVVEEPGVFNIGDNPAKALEPILCRGFRQMPCTAAKSFEADWSAILPTSGGAFTHSRTFLPNHP